MAIVMRMQWPGIGTPDYDKVRDVVRWDQEPAEGGILHVAWEEADGLRVWDVWESADAYGAFVEQRLMPGVRSLGYTSEPVVTISPLEYVQYEGSNATFLDHGAMPSSEAHSALAAEVGWEQEPPVGGAFYIVAREDDGTLTTLSGWETPDAHQTFVEQRVLPALTALGFPTDAEPELERIDATPHAIWTPSAKPFARHG